MSEENKHVPESYVWPLTALFLVIVPQVFVPSRLRVGPPSVVPVIEGVVFVALLAIAARPGPVPRGARPVVLALFGVLLVANTGAAARLVYVVLSGSKVGTAPPGVDRLLTAALLVILTNVVTFGLFYWQIDAGGPQGRMRQPPPYPDFMFPQHEAEGLARPGWQPHFADHLYLSYTNVVAFSPTDAVPMTIRAKGLMTLQSLISLSVLAVVLARVINVLPS
ncbi:MAG TPA: hypothetical protein VMI11_11960 [Actinomycetes bacterium]|nr:hypothetical protein [Actinomycetes bacterium]